MASRVPEWNVLWNNYYDYLFYPNSKKVKELIGGQVNSNGIENTCAARLSDALNWSGFLLPRNFPGLLTRRDKSGRHIAIRVNELRKWLRFRFGKTDFYERKKAGKIFDKSELVGRKGIIGFKINFNNATGHLDLWDGTKFSSEYKTSINYWNAATRIYFWECGK